MNLLPNVPNHAFRNDITGDRYIIHIDADLASRSLGYPCNFHPHVMERIEG